VRSDTAAIKISVVIPVGPAEQGPFPLFEALALLPSDWEVIIALCEHRDDLPLARHKNVYTVISKKGRAVQMNTAAQLARGEFLWFLHLDSSLTPVVIQALEQGIASRPDALHYFLLAFDSDGAGPMALNARGANLRSAWLGVPFGDQGFCLSSSRFQSLGGYDTRAPYGEDHLLVWQARRAGVEINALAETLRTSARKYRQKGWWYLTALYQWRWVRQAMPQFVGLISERVRRKCQTR
jgi:glycosyltransferase involved in cell wall biosynthesis